MGIRGQLALLVSTIAFLAIGALSWAAVRQEHQDQLDDFRLRNERVLQALSVPIAIMVAQNDVGGLDTLVADVTETLKERDLVELAVVDDQLRVLAHSSPALFNTQLETPFVKEAVGNEGDTWARDDRVLRIGVPARSGLRWATVTATFSLDRFQAQYERVRAKWIAGGALTSLLMAVLLFLLLDTLVVRPVRTMAQAVRRMGEGHLATRVPDLRGRELGELAANVNGMAQALQTERDNLEHTVQERTRELQELNSRLERLAVTDGLTGVYNHRRFQEALHSELLRCQRHRRPLGVLMVDVDFFKKVNDAFGHPAGDELLRRLAEVLGQEIRQTDLIARYGGEEFAVVLPETSKSEALHVAERMRAAVEKKVGEAGTWGKSVTVSLGVATYPEDGESAAQVLEAADKALYLAKRQGRNRVVAAKGGPA